jgi:DNA-binding transcriptional regulator GbsR (MarR family)
MPFPSHSLGELQELVLCSIKQPLTAKQLSKQTNLSVERCSAAISELARSGLIECKNQRQQRSRLYFVTNQGMIVQSELRNGIGLPPVVDNFRKAPAVWLNYGFVCFSHRSAIIRTLRAGDENVRPMNAATIKRKAKFNDPMLRMSANNVRDVLKELSDRDIVRKISTNKSKYPSYMLSNTGEYFKKLLVEADKIDFDLVRLWERG